MKIECCVCGCDLGEKCPSCGSRRIELAPPEEFLDGSVRIHIGCFFCLDCDTWFREGEGGKTSTYCRRCKEIQLFGVPRIRSRELSR